MLAYNGKAAERMYVDMKCDGTREDSSDDSTN
jgi:hypothetical protein